MDSRLLTDHAWDTLGAGATSTAPPESPADLERGVDAPAGFQVLSLEQYAASHARSMHEPHDR